MIGVDRLWRRFMDYVGMPLKEEFVIRKIYTVHYFEYGKNHTFEGERHDFWELVYVDKGEIEAAADTLRIKLKQGEMIFHKPNEFHNVYANGAVAPNLVIISFECKSPAIRYFENKIVSISDVEKNYLAQIIVEAKNAYSSPLNDTYLKKLERSPNAVFCSEQLIKLYLELMLIQLVRKEKSIKKENKLSTSVKERSDEILIKKITGFLENSVYGSISFDDVCRFSSLSRTYLKVLFKEQLNMGVMEYYNNLKTVEAKRMIREGNYNFTRIAEMLGYTSIHYFSRHFKKATGMSPSQYALSVKVKFDE